MGYKPTIVVVAYRRLNTLSRLLDSINDAYYTSNEINLIISIDYHDTNKDVVDYANQFEWKHGNKTVVTHGCNLGLRKHIIECGDYAIKYDSIIILEDDEIVAPYYYEYARAAQDYYEHEERVAGVSLYSHEWNIYAGKKFQPIKKSGDVYFGQFSCTWGQSWTSKQWSAFKEWYNRNDEIVEDEKLPRPIYAWKESWGKYFIRYIVETGKYYVLPYHAYSTVYGVPGVHSKRIELDVQVALNQGTDEPRFVNFDEGIHYDAFFENIDIKQTLSETLGVKEGKIAVDLFGLENRVFDGKKYVLSTSIINRKIIKEYDLCLRPHEENVISNMEGTGIFLYDNEFEECNVKKTRRINYDFAGMRGAYAIKYGVLHCISVLLNIIRKREG